MSKGKKIAVVSGAAAVAGAAVAAGRHRAAAAENEPPAFDVTEIAPVAPRPKRDGEAQGPSKADLYERAKELKIRGRTRMTKAELARAIAKRTGVPA